MAVVAINIDPELYKRVATRVREGAYLDLDQFFDLAARNQLALEVQPRRAADDDQVADVEDAASPVEPAKVLDGGPSEQGAGAVRPRQWGAVKRADLPSERFARPNVDPDPDHLLWGQTNRLLPVAVGVRVLANLLQEADDVAVTTWHEKATAVATALRDDLRRWDESANRPHGGRWATAFPEKKDSSAQRYVNQFLGSAREGADGGAVFLGLVRIVGSGEKGRVTLTTSGASWANLKNPIFDAEAPAERTFSDEEVEFFLGHLREFRVGEYEFLNTTAKLVAEGRSRDEQTEAIASAYPRWASVASTMRAGSIGRLGDLGLLERSRHGLKVEYRLSALASSLGLPHETGAVAS